MYWKRLWRLLEMVMVSEESEDSEYDSGTSLHLRSVSSGIFDNAL